MIKWLSNNRSEIIYAILLVLGLIAVIFCLVSVGRKTLTPTESNLLAVSLTFASLFLSWVTTTLYHNTGASRATRDKDVQRANNIQSIKQQLNMLMDWNRKQARSIAENDERMKFHCEHLSEVLTGLDFQFDAMIKEIGGNIGDADRQATELLTSVKVIGTKIQDLESQKQEIEAKSVEAVTPELYDLLQLQIQDITAHQESLKDSMATFITENKSAPATEAKSEFVDLSCPQCGFINKIEMAGFAGETRAHRCRSCDTVFNVHCTSPGIFISRLSAGFNGGGTVRFNGLTTTDGVTDVISPPGFDFEPEEFRAVSTALVAVYAPNQFSIKTLNDAVLARIEDARYTKSRIGKFIQMLFWTRLFELAKPVGDEALAGVLIGNQQITLADVGNSFFRSLGYRMGNLRVVTPSEARRDIEAFLKAAAPALDAEQMTAAYIEGKTAANDAAAARGESL